MKYLKDTAGTVYAFEADGSQDEFIPAGLIPMNETEVEEHLNPHPTYQQELAALNVEWQEKVEGYNKSFALAALSDGPSEESKKAAIRASYEADKAQNALDRAALKVKYGIGGV